MKMSNRFVRMERAARGLLAALVLSVAGLGMANLASADTVLITGANSGIGLELAKQYAEKNWTVIAVHRRDTTPESLASLSKAHPNVRAEKMDVSNKQQVLALANKLKGVPIDVLVNNAGIFCLCDWMEQDNSQRFGTLRYEDFEPIFDTNVKGTIMVSEAFVENVKASKQKKIINISSTVGTISTPGTRAFWYGASKAAVNKITVNLAAVLKPSNVIVVPMHPGAVRVEKQATRQGDQFIETDFSVRNMIATIGKLKISDSGKFTNYDGKELPW
jgi:NAD(P)-dependent dehydrogenase (short-subunit alcohol dehydrogenase family)